MRVIDKFIVVCDLAWKTTNAYDFYEAILVDQNATRMNIPYFALNFLESWPCPYQIIEEVPELGLKEESVDFSSVFKLQLKHIREVFILKLPKRKSTLTMPWEPHIPVD